MLNQVTQPGWDVVAFIRDVGFPIAVAGFLLWRVDRRLQELDRAITRLADQIELLFDLMPKGVKSSGVDELPP